MARVYPGVNGIMRQSSVFLARRAGIRSQVVFCVARRQDAHACIRHARIGSISSWRLVAITEMKRYEVTDSDEFPHLLVLVMRTWRL